MSTTLEGTTLTNKHLLDEELWERLVKRIMKDEDMERTLAERIMDQTLAFLQLCAAEPKGGYSPSPMVDIGWHTFILYTRFYAEFCMKIGSQFIHHEPSDVPGVNYPAGNIGRTVAALAKHGIKLDEQMWLNRNEGCSTYCSGDSCSGGGGDGDPGCKH